MDIDIVTQVISSIIVFLIQHAISYYLKNYHLRYIQWIYAWHVARNISKSRKALFFCRSEILFRPIQRQTWLTAAPLLSAIRFASSGVAGQFLPFFLVPRFPWSLRQVCVRAWRFAACTLFLSTFCRHTAALAGRLQETARAIRKRLIWLMPSRPQWSILDRIPKPRLSSVELSNVWRLRLPELSQNRPLLPNFYQTSLRKAIVSL